MKQQYGNWLVCETNPEGNEEILSALNENRDLSAIELDLDLSDVRTDYVFKEMTDYLKERMELDVNKPYWTAAWKVTV
jgi:hypothetical protein